MDTKRHCPGLGGCPAGAGRAVKTQEAAPHAYGNHPAEAESVLDRQARARREPQKTVHLQYIPAAAGGGDLRRVIEDSGLATADAAVVLSNTSTGVHMCGVA